MPQREDKHKKRSQGGKEPGARPPIDAAAPALGKAPFIGSFERLHAPEGPDVGREAEAVSAPPQKNSRELETPGGTIHIENYFPAEKLEAMRVDDGIRMFSRNNPDRQKKALVKVAGLEGGNVVVGYTGDLLVSYVGIHRPSERERWGKPGYDWLFELGAIEVSRNFRELGLAEEMLDTAFDDPYYDDKIMLTTAFTWHWDLEGTGMDKLQYRQLFLHLAAMYGFIEMATDEPNISMDASNLFLVRLGKNASFSRYQRFASLLYSNEWEAMLRGF